MHFKIIEIKRLNLHYNVKQFKPLKTMKYATQMDMNRITHYDQLLSFTRIVTTGYKNQASIFKRGHILAHAIAA